MLLWGARCGKPARRVLRGEDGARSNRPRPSSTHHKRGTAEQWIKAGKEAVKMTRLSCHRFRANEVQLWLCVIAYNLGNLWRRLALPTRIDTRGGCSGRSHGGLRRCRCRRDSRAFVAAGGAVSAGGGSGVRKTG